MQISIREYLENQKIEKGLNNEDLANYNGISVDSLRSIFKGEVASQLLLQKIMKANSISLLAGKKLFTDFNYTRDTLKGVEGVDYVLGKQKVRIKSIEIVENKHKALRVILKNDFVYVKTIPIYDKEFNDFEECFNLDIMKNGIVEELKTEHYGYIEVKENESDILEIEFLRGV